MPPLFSFSCPHSFSAQHEVKPLRADSGRTFYDSVYRKARRHKVSRFLYNLAFVPRTIKTLPDSIQHLKNDAPYLKYRGKIIRHIWVETLDPFGPTVLDTSGRPLTGIGKIGDKMRLKTRKYVIRKNLLFRPGQPVDPSLLADNERILKNLPFIDDVRFILASSDSTSDSVDVTVVTKDVFSIGFDLITLSPQRSVFRLYDGNFLGLGDRFANVFSFENHRAPFTMEEGVTYNLTNIGATFIDGVATYLRDDIGNEQIGFELQRSFFSNKTRWAGNGSFQYQRDVSKLNDSATISAYRQDANLWVGRSFILGHKAEPVRIILSEAGYERHYFSRPLISIDSNKHYYNYLQLFTGISVSRNNYYLTDYVFEMGKSENIPYGYLFQLTFGPEFNDFYARLYNGVELGYGDFIKKFGYLSGTASFSGFFHSGNFEDAILKVQGRYMTFLYYTPDKKYKFRSYLMTDYRYGFNFLLNNKDLSNINQDLLLYKTVDQNSLQGTSSLTASLSTLVYTPWYFYGFKFALMGQIQGGFVANRNIAMFATPFFTGIRTGVVVKNDNLIFPSLVFSVFFYPTTPSGGYWFQFLFDLHTGLQIPDFNVTAPREETLQN